MQMKNDSVPRISAVVPCFNEEKALAEFVRRLSAACRAAPGICVNSASFRPRTGFASITNLARLKIIGELVEASAQAHQIKTPA
jgi:hypothetical protein